MPVNQKPGTSPSKGLTDAAKTAWQGGIPKGTEKPNVNDAYNKKPITVPGSGKK